MIVLHQYENQNGKPSLSPFCLKLEAWLKLTGLSYHSVDIGDPSEAPKGQAPWITDTNGMVIGDSTLIIEHLKRNCGVDPDADLSPQQQGIAAAVAALCEERLYYTILRFRWIEPGGWVVLKDLYFGQIPEPMRTQLAEGLRQEIRQKLHFQGYGRHSTAEIAALGIANLTALADLLGDQPWLFGEHPMTADCIAWATISNLVTTAFEHPVAQAARSMPALIAYRDRGLARFFPGAEPA